MDLLSFTDAEKAKIKVNVRKWRVKPGPPVITIFVRHSAECKYRGDEFCKRCDCPKHLRWSQYGKQQRVAAQTRSWAQAENKKRDIEDQLSGRTPETKPDESAHGIQDAIDLFIQDKKNQGITDKVVGKYTASWPGSANFASTTMCTQCTALPASC